MRQVIIYATLLVALLVAAWLRWTAEPGADADDVVVLLPGAAEDITAVTWKSKDDEVVFTRKSDAHGDYLWVEHTKWEEKPIAGPELPPDPAAPPQDPAVPSQDPAAPEPVVPVATERVATRTLFKASAKGDELMASLGPLKAIRKLEATAEKLTEIGLDAPTETLVIERKGQAVTLDIGGEAYGTKDRYVRNQGTGEIFLVDDQILKNISFARTRMQDRDLWSLARPAIASIRVASADGRQVEMEQKNADDEAAATWVRRGQETKDEAITTWLDKALKLKGTSTVDLTAADAPKDLQPRFTMTLTPSGKGKPETLEILQDGAEGDWYGRSEHTRATLKLLKAPTRAVNDDLAGLLQ